MTILDVALGYHSLGLVVIPLQKGFKLPRDTSWQKEKNQTEERVRELFASHDGNIGIVCGSASRLVVFDIDVKGGTKGLECLAAWEAKHGPLPHTLTMSTPSGGQHRWFRLPPGRKVQKHKLKLQDGAVIRTVALGDIDVMGDNAAGGGFQIAVPPSVLEGEIDPKGKKQCPGAYQVLVDAPIADWPEKLLDQLPEVQIIELAAPATAVEEHVADVPRAWRIAQAKAYAAAQPPAIEGQGGDARTWNVMNDVVHDWCLTDVEMINEALLEWNSRCQPPWQGTQWAHKLNGVLHNATRQWKTTELFMNYAVAKPVTASSPPASSTEPPSDTLGIIWGRWDEPAVIPPYLLQGLIPAGKVVTIFAEGGSVKSWAAFALAISVATGRPWLDSYIVQSGRTLILDFEDGREEFKRRKRMLTHNDDDIPTLGYKYSTIDLLNPETWVQLATLGLKLLVIDALGSAMPGDADENATAFAAAVKLAGKFTEATEATGHACTVVFIHHANKQGGMRGTSAIRDQSDVAFKFEPVSETDDVKRMRMVCDKPGPQRKPAPVNLELSDKGLVTFKDEAQTVGRNSDSSESIQAAIKLALANGFIETKKKIRKAVGKAQKIVDDEVDALVTKREVVFIHGQGYGLDGPAQRLERVVRNVQSSDRWTSVTKLAKASYVDGRFVDQMIRDRVICHRVSTDERHGFMVVNGLPRAPGH